MPKFTDRGVAAIKATADRQQISDDLVPGLQLVVQATGRKSWAVRYRAGGTMRRLTLGRFPEMGVAAARDAARAAMANVQAGRDVQAEKERAKADTVAAVVAEFKTHHLDRLKSGANAHGFLLRSIVAEHGHRPVREITKRDLSKILLGYIAEGKTTTANRTFAHLRAFFNWAASHGYVDAAVTERMKMPAVENARDRWLDDREIALFWRATEEMATPYRQALRVLLLTGQRHGEVVGMTEAEIQGDTWILPPERVKNGRAHDVPLSGAVLAELENLPRIGGAGLLFTTNGKTPIQNLNDKADEAGAIMAELAGEELPRWRPHDLRRTLETGMARLGIAESLIDRVTNHISGIPKIRRVYQHYDFAKERRDAMDKWAKHVLKVAKSRKNSSGDLSGLLAG